jgi:membrane protease YdiL (CAAX protease family)
VTRERRPLPSDLADTARSALPVGLLILAAAVPQTRLFVLAALVAGCAVAVRRDANVRWAWAAPIPVAMSLCWGLVPAPLADPLGADCTALDSPPAIWRATEAGLALASLTVLAYVLRARRSDLGLRWPARSVVQVAVAGAVILGPIGLLLGALLARPFFGSFELDLGQPGFILPALVFAIANGVMEELSYRGALLGWTSRVTGTWLAVVGQAVVFGLAHGGADVGGAPIVLMLALGVGGLLAGVIASRTRSLLLPIAWHVALDLPLYVYLACRVS